MNGLIVYDLKDLNKRKININNYSEDLETGFICFDRSILKILEEKYIICGYYIFNKTVRIFIDIMKDKIVFTEGMFNRLENSIKGKICSFNMNLGEQPKFYDLCSKFMCELRIIQLSSCYYNNGPLITLLSEIEADRKLINKMYKQKLNIYEPINYIEFCYTLNSITELFEYHIENYDYSDEIKELYLSALNFKRINYTYDQLLEYFYKYLWLIVKERYGV